MEQQGLISTSDLDGHIGRVHQQYHAIAFGGGQIDHLLLERAVKDAYALIGKPPPQLLIFESPLASMQAVSSLSVKACAPIHEKFGRPFWNRFERELASRIGADLRHELRDQLIRQLGRQVGQLSAVLGQYLGPMKCWCPDFLWGSQDLHRIALGICAQQAGCTFSPEVAASLSILDRIGRQCEWWWPFEDAVVVSERPATVIWDHDRQLHCENAAAVRYADGLELFAWHGLGVPPHWILDRANIDPAEVIRQDNVELRAVGTNLAGLPKMLSFLDCRVVDDSGSGDIGQLIELTLPGLSAPGRFLKALCPRNGIIIEGVPYVSDIDRLPIDTALAAQAWRIGDPQSDYQHPPRRT